MEGLLAASERGRVMASFKFFLIGTNEAPVMEVPFANLQELNKHMQCNRFIEGCIMDISGEEITCGALLPICRIQMVVEVLD